VVVVRHGDAVSSVGRCGCRCMCRRSIPSSQIRMSGLIVAAVTRAIAFEVAHGVGFALAMDRLWFWRVCDLSWHPEWHPRANTAAINHFLAVHRENHRKRLSPPQVLPVGRLPGLVEAGGCRKAAAPPASPGHHVPASNTTPGIPIVGILGRPGGQ